MNFLRLIGNREYIISCRQQRNIDLIIQIDNSIFYEFPGKIVNKVRIAFKINFEIKLVSCRIWEKTNCRFLIYCSGIKRVPELYKMTMPFCFVNTISLKPSLLMSPTAKLWYSLWL